MADKKWQGAGIIIDQTSDVHISGTVFADCNIGIAGSAKRVVIDGIDATDVPTLIDSNSLQDAEIKNIKIRNAPPIANERPKKFFSGFNFSKGDHLKR